MANEVVRGGVGQLALKAESALGTGTGSWLDIRADEIPTIPTNTRVLIANHIAGFRNPMSTAKPVAIEQYRADAFRLKQRIRRPLTDGGTPILSYLFQAAGWQADTGPTAIATSAGAPTTTSIVVDDATGIVAGEACLVELAGVYYPTLAASVTMDVTDTIVPSIAMSAAQDGSTDVVEAMHTFTPTTATGYQIPTDKTIEFMLNTLGYHTAGTDLSATLLGCAVADIGSLEIGGVGTVPTLDFGIHVGDVAVGADAIDADSFNDSEPFGVVTKDAQFAFAVNNSGSGIAALVSKFYQKLTFNFNTKVICVGGTGYSGGLNGLQCYLLQQGRPTCTIETVYKGDSVYEHKFWTELEGSNTSMYIHFIQPTTNLDHPAFGVWMPNCHLMAGGEPQFDATGELITVTATFEADLGAWGGNEDIDDVTAAPIVFAVSSEAAAA